MASQEALVRRRAAAQARVAQCRELLRLRLGLASQTPARHYREAQLAQVAAWEEMADFLDLVAAATCAHEVDAGMAGKSGSPKALQEPLVTGVDQAREQVVSEGKPLQLGAPSHHGTQPAQGVLARRPKVRRAKAEEGGTN